MQRLSHQGYISLRQIAHSAMQKLGLSSSPQERGRPGLATIMIETFNITQDRITRSRLAGDPPDIHIKPALGRIGLFEFHRAADAIALGGTANLLFWGLFGLIFALGNVAATRT